MPGAKTVALVAHDNMKDELLAWVGKHRDALAVHRLVATGTTGRLVAEASGLEVERLKSGPLGGDQQLGALIAEGRVDVLIFFWDPLEPMPHDPDVRALLRIAVVWNVATACNEASADFMVASPHFREDYTRTQRDYENYRRREVPTVTR